MTDPLETVWRYASSPVVLAIASVLAAAISGHLFMRLLQSTWSGLARRTRAEWDDQLAARLGGPLSMLISLQLLRVVLRWFSPGPGPERILREGINVLTIFVVVWGVFRVIDVARATLSQRSWAIERPASRSLLSLGTRFAKGAVLVMGGLVALSHLGVSIASLIAGLGIGGLVIALAAQKTVENLFGTISIGLDQPMREGDFVRVNEFLGTVEQIGLRSTRIRTLDRTLVTIPNGELSNQRIESYTARDRIRLACMIGLEYGTPAARVREVIAALRRVLREHPKIWPDAVIVRLAQFAESSLAIEIMAWFQTCDFGEFQGIREEVLLAFMDEIEAAGARVAVPARRLHVAGPAQGSAASALSALGESGASRG